MTPVPPRLLVLAPAIAPALRSALPRVLHRVGGRTVLDAVLDAAEAVSPSRVLVVAAAGRDRIADALSSRSPEFEVVDLPDGGGEALVRALSALGGGDAPILVLAGDTPLVTGATLRSLVERRANGDLDAALLTFRPPDASAFPRVVRDVRGRLRRIVPAGEGSGRPKAAEALAGVYCLSSAALPKALPRLRLDPGSGAHAWDHAIAALLRSGARVETVEAPDWREAWPVTTRRDLAAAEEIEHRRRIERALDSGATIVDPATVRLGPRVSLEPDAVIHPFVSLEGSTRIGEGAEVLSFTRIADSVLAAGAVVGPHCDLDGARIGERSRVGPFARMRPNSVIERDVKVGNFVETKNTILHDGVKAQHLSYLGDAEIGARSNIGAGVITCNYDGTAKHRTSIGEGVFVGSDAQLVAPVTVGKGAYVGAGSTITEDVPEGALALSRTPQTNVEGWVERRKEKLRRDSGHKK